MGYSTTVRLPTNDWENENSEKKKKHIDERPRAFYANVEALDSARKLFDSSYLEELFCIRKSCHGTDQKTS